MDSGESIITLALAEIIFSDTLYLCHEAQIWVLLVCFKNLLVTVVLSTLHILLIHFSTVYKCPAV